MKRVDVTKMLAKGIADVAKHAVKNNVNMTCTFWAYQPKLPKGAEKLKK